LPDGVLITGGHGYLGSVLVERALRRNYRVHLLDCREVAMPAHLADRVVHIAGDLRRPGDWASALRHVETVVHLGAVVGDAACDLDPDGAWETNYLGTVHVAEACRKYGVGRLVFASTCSSYGATGGLLADVGTPVDPQSLYARTKLFAEHHLLTVRHPGLEVRILRMATLYGLSPRMRFDLVVNVMTARAVHEGVIEVYGGDQWRPLLHVRDAADAILATLAADTAGPVMNCGDTAENYRIADVARLVQAEVRDAGLVFLAGGGDPRNYRVNFEAIRRELGFRPEYSLRDGVREIADALRGGRYPDYRAAKYANHLVADGAGAAR
jgi:nucleoside-diphosphate-sugar epimerase